MIDPTYITHGEYDDEPELDRGWLIASEDDLWLISDADVDTLTDSVELSTLDKQPGRVRLHYDDRNADGIQWTDREYDSFRDARLMYGLQLTVGDYREPESDAIPRPVALGGMEAIAAYLRAHNKYSRSKIASDMDVSKQTISNYWNRMRWTAGEDTEIAVFDKTEQ